MKNKLNETVSRYTDKCQRMKKQALRLKLHEFHKTYGGSYYLYVTLLERGFIEGNKDNLHYTGAIPSEKEMRSIIRHTNTLTRNAKKASAPKKKRTYTKRSEHWKKLSNKVVDLTVGVAKSVTVDICLNAMEREIKAHRANGVDATHIKNLAKISADLVKIMQ